MTIRSLSLAVIATLLLAGCGQTKTGIFADARVEGLDYRSGDIVGVTNSIGEFKYPEDQKVTFAIGGIVLGSAAGNALITPLDLVPGGTLDTPAVLNIARLLQALDSDQTLSNGIQISDAVRAAARSVTLDFNQSTDAFGTEGGAADSFVEAARNDPNANLPSAAQARAELVKLQEEYPRHGGAPNLAPTADAGADQSVIEGAMVTLTGKAQDDDGTVADHTWTQTGGPAVVLSGTGTNPRTFTAPQVTQATDLVFKLVVTDNEGATSLPDSMTVTVQDSANPSQATFSINDVSANEGNSGTKTFSFTITRGGDLTQAVSVHAATADGTATTADSDYVAVADTAVNFAANETTQTFSVTVNGDTKVETDETFFVNLSNPSANATITHAQGVGTITNDDTAPGQATFSINDVSANEGNSGTKTFSFTITRGGDLTQAVSVHAATADGTATTADSDYVAVADTAVNFAANETTQTFSVTVNGDTKVETDETFFVNLSNPSANATITHAQGVGTITNDDSAASLCVIGNGLCAGSAKFTITPSDSQIAGEDEPRFESGGVVSVKQYFHLGGFGFGPFEQAKLIASNDPTEFYDERTCEPFTGQCLSNERAKRAFHCPGFALTCDESVKERTWVRAFYLADPADANNKMLFITIDAVGAGNIIQNNLKAAVSAATGVAPDNILFGQTHSHAGADLQGLWGGVPQTWVTALYAAAVDAANAAKANAQNVKLTYATGQEKDFSSYRRPRVDPTADTDKTLSVLQAKAGDTVVGTIVQYAAHPTAVGTDAGGAAGRAAHPDYVLGLADTIESKTHATALYYNGVIADASGSGPTTGTDDYQRVRSRGDCLAKSALEILGVAGVAHCGTTSGPTGLRQVPLNGTLKIAKTTATLPVTNPLFVAVAAEGGFARYYNFTREAVAAVPPLQALAGMLPPDFPQVAPIATTTVSRISIGGDSDGKGGLQVVTIPGEATNTYGQYIRGLAKDYAASSNVMLLGLTHNSFGYILPEEEFNYVDPSGDAGFVAPFTGYEEYVSLGPLTAPLLRLQAYNPLFNVAADDPRNLPPSVTACQADYKSRACLTSRLIENVDYIQRSYASTCRDNGGPEQLCSMIDPDTPANSPCRSSGMIPDAVCDIFGPPPSGNTPSNNTPDQVLLPAIEAQTRGCDLLDPANCLYPFPSDHFTADAAANSPQSTAKGGTGKRVNFNPLSTPRNTAGKPVDPTEWNRNDGFSPGALIATYVPGLSLEKTYGLPSSQIGVANIGLSQSDTSPMLVIDATKKLADGSNNPDYLQKQLVWTEIDANANLLTPLAVTQVGTLGPDIERPAHDGRAALLIRPAKNFAEGHRYVVVLRNLKDQSGAAIPAQAPFQVCRDDNASFKQLPPYTERCGELESNVFPVLTASKINPRDPSVYLAWDFTVASANNQIGRLRHMRDDAFKTLSSNPAVDDCTEYHAGCAAPGFTVDKVTKDGDMDRIEGVITVPSYLSPADPAPLDDPAVSRALIAFCDNLPADAPSQFKDGCESLRGDGYGLISGLSAPNRLFYSPADGSPSGDRSNLSDPLATRYGDGLPDRTGTMQTKYICRIPPQATPDHPARPGVYGHGLLDRGVAVDYDGVPDLSREFNFMFCAVDWYGFATGDLANVASQLVDVSNFPVVPDASQQGILNFMFLARLLRDPNGFAAHPAFQDAASHLPRFNGSEVFYDGNSQGGIMGGAVIAASKDIHRGVLGSLGMNYSTLLTRSKDFDEFAPPLYASYTDPLDRQLLFSMIQMLWDRSENDGYAAHLTDNSAFGGTTKAVKLDPNFGDQQVTMWSADVMARTMGIPVDHQQTPRVAAIRGDAPRHPDVVPYFGMQSLDYSDAQMTAGSAEIVWDRSDIEIPPITNTPPRVGNDPHDTSAKRFPGRCQKAHFMAEGRLIDITPVVFDGAACPALTPAAAVTSTGTLPQPGFADQAALAVKRFQSALSGSVDHLSKGEFKDALDGVLAGVQQLIADASTAALVQAGQLAGIYESTPATQGGDNPEPSPLMAGAAKGQIRVPVGTPLGGYLRPPVGGEYIGEDPVGEITDNIPNDGCDPSNPPSCPPNVPLPDELRKIHSPYATYSPPSRGYYDSLLAKAVALYDGHDYVVLVKTDFIGMLDEVVQDVKKTVKARTVDGDHPQGIDLGNGLIMSATHTHDGPGAVANNSTRYFWLAMDTYQHDVYLRVVGDLADVVVAALNSMHPAKIGHTTGLEQLGMNHYRRGRFSYYKDNDAPGCNWTQGPCTAIDGDDVAEVPTDANEMRRRIGLLEVRDTQTNAPIALVVNYSAHGIAFDVENQYFSGDILASLEREVEQTYVKPVGAGDDYHAPIAMLIQNTTGDVTPSADYSIRGIEQWGKKIAPEIRAIADRVSDFDDKPDLRTVSQRIVLNRKTLGYKDDEYPYPWGAAQCGNDIEVPFAGVGVNDIPGYANSGAPTKQPYCIFGTPPDAPDLADNGVAENGAFLPGDTILSAVRIGSITLIAQPGEPLTEYGVRVMEMAEGVGYNPLDTFIWGYTGDHVGYILPPVKEDWATFGGAESTTTFWGWKQGERFMDVSKSLLVALRDGKPAPADEFQVDYSKYRALYDAKPHVLPTPSLLPGSIVSQPTDIKRFEKTAFVFEGGDPVVDFPQVEMQHADGTPVLRANGEPLNTMFEMHLKYRLVTGRHLWTVEFEAPKDWATGSYKFAVSGKANQGADKNYEITSNLFAVSRVTNLRFPSAPRSRANNTRCEVALDYGMAYPSNYRIVDANTAANQVAPVRGGSVVFSGNLGMATGSANGRYSVAVEGGCPVGITATLGSDASVTPNVTSSASAASIGPDADEDNIGDGTDLCPNTPAGEAPDAQGCAASQRDTDSDGIKDKFDNCPTTANPDQKDTNGNGIGDACEGNTPTAGFPIPLCDPTPFDAGCLDGIPVIGEPLQSALDTIYNTVAGGGVPEAPPQLALVQAMLEAQTRGCDLLDPANCLLPFPSDHFTVPAAKGSPQGVDSEGTGKRINFNPLAMPRNMFGRPIDPTEWNRNDGFSPGQLIVTYVPNIGTVKDASGKPLGPITGAVSLTDLARYADPNAPILVLDADTGERHPIWAEIDLNAGYLLPMQGFGPRTDKKPALLIRPARNFLEGHRYIVVLRNLKDDEGQPIRAQLPFQSCRDSDPIYTRLPPLTDRCAELNANVFPMLESKGMRNDGLYLAWDFTVASAHNNVARLKHMRDDAFGSLGETDDTTGKIISYGRKPTYVVTQVTENPDGNTARRIQGTLTVPSYVIPADPSPLDGDTQFRGMIASLQSKDPGLLSGIQGQCRGSPVDDNDPIGVFCDLFNPNSSYDTAASGSLPPNRLNYLPDESSAKTCDPDAAQVAGGCALQARYGDGLPDRNPTGDLTTTFTCNIPRSAISNKASMADATPDDVKPVRPTLYGHGLLGGQGEANGQASDFGNRYGFMVCAADWFGFAGGDVPNVASALVDLSNFAVIPDGAQQGVLNQLFLARLAVHPDGFAADPNFQVGGKPVFDRREVFYDGNSQGGIMGGVVVAASKDINRGVLGVPGMNYSTLLSRSTDFALYSVPLYLSYQDDLERPFIMSLIQMIWDRAENNGYAEHIADNSAMGGTRKQLLLTPAYGDHQVTMWSADVMARTIGASVDRQRITPPRLAAGGYPADPNAELDLPKLDYSNLTQASGSALVPYDQTWKRFDGDRCDTNTQTKPAPIGNVPPNRSTFGVGPPLEAPASSFNTDAGSDPHECPRRDPQARCQMSHFLLGAANAAAGGTSASLIDPSLASRSIDDYSAGCPVVTIVGAPESGGSAGSSPPDYGTGVIGAFAQLMSRFHDVIVAFVSGDFSGAGSQLVAALSEFGQNLEGVGSSADPSRPATTIAGLAQEPITPNSEEPTHPGGAIQQAVSANRDIEAVVITGAQIPTWSVPAAYGVPKPYPSGTPNDGSGVLPSPFDRAGDNVRDAHNGVMIYPQSGYPTGMPVNQIAAYKYENGAFVEIAVQVDEKYPYFLANAHSNFSTYSGTDEELTYAWDKEHWNPGDSANRCFATFPNGAPDPVSGLDNDDEIVFMASDAGTQAPVGVLPKGATSVQLVRLNDLLDPAAQRVVYLVTQPNGSRFTGQKYVHYSRNDNADQWIDRSFFAGDTPVGELDPAPDRIGTSNTDYGPNLHGTVCPTGAPPTQSSSDRFPRDGVTVSTDNYRWQASGRWMVRDLRVRKPGQTVNNAAYWDSRPDLIDRWKGRAFQQSPDSNISVVGFEDEQVNWEANSAVLGERCGPVRCIREIWGADSGTNVTKTETFYRDAISYRFHVRVHPIPPDGLYTSWDYNRGAMIPTSAEKNAGVKGGRYFTALRPQGVPIDGVNDDIGQVDGLMPITTPQGPMCLSADAKGLVPPSASGRCPAFFDAADPTFNLPLAFDNWEQVSGKGDLGSLVYTFELKGPTSAVNPLVVPYYRDDACLDDGTGDDPVPRPFPGESYDWDGPRGNYPDAVKKAYDTMAGRPLDYTGSNRSDCAYRQGAYGAHGIHYFVTHDSDNLFVEGKPLTEIDGQQWQIMVPTDHPHNVAEPYANTVRVPLQPQVTPWPGAGASSSSDGFTASLVFDGQPVPDQPAGMPTLTVTPGQPLYATATLRMKGADGAYQLAANRSITLVLEVDCGGQSPPVVNCNMGGNHIARSVPLDTNHQGVVTLSVPWKNVDNVYATGLESLFMDSAPSAVVHIFLVDNGSSIDLADNNSINYSMPAQALFAAGQYDRSDVRDDSDWQPILLVQGGGGDSRGLLSFLGFLADGDTAGAQDVATGAAGNPVGAVHGTRDEGVACTDQNTNSACALPAPLGSSPAVGGGAFKVGAAKKDSTPSYPICTGGYGIFCGYVADHVRPNAIEGADNLFTRAIAIESAGTPAAKIVIVTTSAIGLFASYKDEVTSDGRTLKRPGLYDTRVRLAQATGIPFDHIFIQSDHSHRSPDTIGIWGGVPTAYLQQLQDDMVSVATEALNHLEPANLFVGAVEGNKIACGGTYPIAPGSATSAPLKCNVESLYSYDPLHVVDDQFRVLEARRTNGTRIASFVNYSPHATVLDGIGTAVLSGDWTGWMAAMLDGSTACGGTDQPRCAVGLATVATLGRENFGSGNDVGSDDALNLNREKAARARLNYFVDKLRTASAPNAAPITGVKPFTAVRGSGIQTAEIFMREHVTNPIFYGNYVPYVGVPQTPGENYPSTMQAHIDRNVVPPFLTGTVLGTFAGAFRIGDVFFATAPGEEFPNAQDQIRDHGGVTGPQMHFFLGATNDFLGYMGPARAYDQVAAQGLTYLAGCLEDWDENPLKEQIKNGRDSSPANGAYNAGRLYDTGSCPDHFILMSSPTIGDHVLCTIQDAAEQLGFGVATRDPACLALTAADGVGGPSSPSGALNSQVALGGPEGGALPLVYRLVGDLLRLITDAMSGALLNVLAGVQSLVGDLINGAYDVLIGNPQSSVVAVASQTLFAGGDNPLGAPAALQSGLSNILNGSAGAGIVKAGVAVVDMTPDVGYCSGQYCWGQDDNSAAFDVVPGLGGNDGIDPFVTAKTKQKSYGVQSRLTARAIVVEGSNGKRVALVKSDNYLAQDALIRRVAQILQQGRSGIGYDQILYGVTHNHTAAYSSTVAWGVAVFEDVFDPRFFESQARKLAQAIEQAAAGMVPARMGATTVRHTIFKGNVVGIDKADDGTPAGYPLEYGDHGLVVMRFDNISDPYDPKPLAVWINWGEHPETLEPYDLHSADFLGPLERFVEREIGAPLVFSQGDVGSSEESGNPDQLLKDDGTVCGNWPHDSLLPAPPNNCPAGQGVIREWEHRGYAQAERNVRFLADDIKVGWDKIGSRATDVQVQMSDHFVVDYRNAFVPGPLSHPYPSVSNCKTDTTANGDVGVPVVGLPDCGRFGFPGDNPVTAQAALIYATAKAEGVPVPDHYDFTGFTGVEENARIKLQTVRLGEVLLASCACEAQMDLILNLESRANNKVEDIYDGFDWACLNPPSNDPYAQACAVQKQYYDPAEFPTTIPGSLSDPGKVARMRAQVHNDARGWDLPQNAVVASSEAADIKLIWGNFTKEELPERLGYALPVGVGHAGDYNGYTVSYREYMNRDSYRKALTAYGPHTADYMVTRLVRMAGAMKGGPELQAEPQDTMAQADEARQKALSTALGQATSAAFDAWQAALPMDKGPAAIKSQPADIRRFNAATFTWVGGNTQADNPVAKVQQQQQDGSWKDFADMTGEVQTMVKWPQGLALAPPSGAPEVANAYAGQYEWLWTANFEAYTAMPARLGSTPIGSYRFVVNGCINDGLSSPQSTLQGNATGRLASILKLLAPDGANAIISDALEQTCPGGARSYKLTSESFDVQSGDAPARSYVSPFPFISNEANSEGRDPRICERCSFRPWEGQ